MRLKAWHFVVPAMALAAGVAGWRLGDEPFWLDEFVTWRWAHLPFTEIWPYVAHRNHPPMYLWFMHGWVRLVPSVDEFWLRLPSVLFFVGTVPVMYRIGRMLSGTPRAGVYAAFLVATWPFLLHYGREARPYAMLTFFGVCAFLATAHLVSRYREEARPRLIGAGLLEAGRLAARGELGRSWRALGDDGAWGLYIASSVVAMLVHNTAGILPMVTGFILLCALLVVPSFRGLRFANLCIATALVALFYAPHVPHLLSSMGQLNHTWIPPTDMSRIARTFHVLYDNGRFPFVVLAGLALAAMAAWVWRGQWERLAFAGIGWLGAAMLLIAFSFWTPLLKSQFLLWTLAPFLAACAAGIALVPWNFVRILLLVALLASSSEGVVRDWGLVKQDWRGLARMVARDASPGAAMIVCPNWNQYVFRYYWKRQGGEGLRFHLIRVQEDPPKIFEAVGPSDDWGPEVSPAELLAEYPEVWLAGDRPACMKAFDPLPPGSAEKPIRTWKFAGAWLRRYGKGEE